MCRERTSDPEVVFVTRYENACSEAEQHASDVLRATKHVERAASGIRKAAVTGDHGAMGSGAALLREALSALEATAHAALRSWPFDDEQLTSYLQNGYEGELVGAAKDAGLAISVLDDRLASFPVVIQIQPTQRLVKLDTVRLSSLRPSHVAERIKAQQKKAGAKPQQFVEVLFRAYQRTNGTSGAGAKLVDLYEVLTLLPESRRVYSRAEFARDVFLLDTSDVRATKTGAIVSFPAATALKQGRDWFVVVPPSGMPKHYYGIRFQEAKP